MATKTAQRSETNGQATDETTATPSEAAAPSVLLARVKIETMLVPIIGTSPLIVSRFTEKQKRAMLATQQKRKEAKEPRDPDAEYESSLYLLDDETPGMPAVAFKAATISASRFYARTVKMVELRQFLFFQGEMSKQAQQQLVRIVGEHHSREDVVRLAGPSRSADLRYRAEFSDWSTTLTVAFAAGCISRDSILSLIHAGGFGVGVGEWRPERNGELGRYEIDCNRPLILEVDGDREEVRW